MVDQMLYLSSYEECAKYHAMAIGLSATTQSPWTDGIIRFIGTLPETKNGNVYVFLIVDLFSRHAEGYAMTKDKKTARGCASDLAGNEEW